MNLRKLKSLIKAACFSLLLSAMCLLTSVMPAQAIALNPVLAPVLAGLPPGNAITDGAALLRYALPIDNKEIRSIQGDLEEISEWLRSKRWGPMKKDVNKVERVLNRKRDAILASVPEDRQAQANQILDSLAGGLEPIREAIEAEDKEGVWTERKQLLDQVGELEELMVDGFPFEVPAEYDNLPQLKGRATVKFETTKGDVTVVADGYSAPVTAGNFVDLVNKKFYDDMPFIRAEDFYVLQTGDPEGPDAGYIDPETGEYRAIPMEILVKGDDEPIYGFTLEEIGQYMDEPVLPFNSYGSLALARPSNDNNGGSSQFFFFLFEAELTPAGRNMLDGRYAVFGYTIDGKEVLRSLSQDDKIISASVIDGLENLEQPG
ncbi:peptidylprolyl isomerase [Synechococcus sp. PCC 7335]|uniref:peptidylprolyl isomerase n=1 Tax=Synechococcus sp. (strain ATCC 29403 / PCC 7335) TaxID=91464 RepID=UPI000682CB0C|nr:peptidylprolyl isomerase [Synechococcus sp. PCC 7335]